MQFQVFSFEIETFMTLDAAARALRNKFVPTRLGNVVIDKGERRNITIEERNIVFNRSDEISCVQNPPFGGILPIR